MNYLHTLTARLSDGLARLPEEFRARHAGYLTAAQNPDGGWSGREGGSDLYYTGFGLRGLAVLRALTPQHCERVAPFLRHSLTQHASVVDFFSLLYSCVLIELAGVDVLGNAHADWPERVAAALETFRTSDGGYAKTPGSYSGSTYHSFLVGLCYQLLGKEQPRRDELIRFIHARRRDDGGFVEIAPMRRSGTNPTAGAIGALQLASDGLTEELRAGVVDFLARMPGMEGGLRANDRAPLSDLLSTFTGSWTLAQLGALDRLELDSVREFVESLELSTGGFRGGIWDDRADVEYTFYGMGVLALLSSTRPSEPAA
jgi:geranylgeranyl transferase type-2 subunit beta